MFMPTVYRNNLDEDTEFRWHGRRHCGTKSDVTSVFFSKFAWRKIENDTLVWGTEFVLKL